MKFQLTENQIKRYTEWLKNQPESNDCIGISVSFTFVPTSLGTTCKVQSLITENVLDLTEYENW